MKNLDQEDISKVCGGNGIIMGIGLGIGSAYVYEAMGGKEGIDEYVEKSWESTLSSMRYWGRKIERAFDIQQH